MGRIFSFSDDNKLLALVDQAGVLTIWDTATNALKQKYSPNFHLMGQCTTLTWVLTTQSGKKKHGSTENTTLYLVLGTSKGQLHLYSHVESQVVKQLKGEGHTGCVIAITKNDDGSIFYTCGEDSQVISWSLGEAKQLSNWSIGSEKPSSILYVSNLEAVVVGFRNLRTYSVQTHDLIQTYTGHTSEIHLLALLEFSKKKNYIVSTSRLDRTACIWKMGLKSKQNRAAVCTLLLDDVAVCMKSSKTKDEDCIQLIVVTKSGVMQIYTMNINEINTDKPIKPQLTINITSNDATIGKVEPIRFLTASPLQYSMPFEVVFAYGSEQCMVFETLTPNFDDAFQVLLRTDPKSLFSNKKSKKTDADVELKNKMRNPIIEENNVKYKASNSMVIGNKRITKHQDISMESRLQNLELNSLSSQSGKENFKFCAQSKVQLLIQALHSKDEELLNTVLITENSNVIQATIEKLPMQYVEPLVQELMKIMQENHVNIQCAANWLKPLLQTHFSHLLSWGADEIFSIFAPCLGMIEQRSQCINEMMKLRGRLIFLVDQIKRNASIKEPLTSNSACLTINDGADSDLEETNKSSNSVINDSDEMDIDSDIEEDPMKVDTDFLVKDGIIKDIVIDDDDDDNDNDDA